MKQLLSAVAISGLAMGCSAQVGAPKDSVGTTSDKTQIDAWWFGNDTACAQKVHNRIFFPPHDNFTEKGDYSDISYDAEDCYGYITDFRLPDEWWPALHAWVHAVPGFDTTTEDACVGSWTNMEVYGYYSTSISNPQFILRESHIGNWLGSGQCDFDFPTNFGFQPGYQLIRVIAQAGSDWTPNQPVHTYWVNNDDG